MKCPECENEMLYVGSNDYEEDNFYNLYNCNDCRIDVYKYWSAENDGDATF